MQFLRIAMALLQKLQRIRDAKPIVTHLLEQGAGSLDQRGRSSVKALRFAGFTAQKYIDGSVAPAMNAVLDIQKAVAGGVISALKGEKSAKDVLKETVARAKTGLNFSKIVQTYGNELFGTATYEGEVLLAEDAHYRVSYLPPPAGVTEAPVRIFHSGGAIPYGDRLFRMLPEANLFQRFLERGIGVYVMELRGDRDEIDYSGVTMETLIDSIAMLSTKAFEHGGKKKMILEGYCGHGMQAMAYAAAKPEDADEKFSLLATFVSPVDGRECSDLGEMMQLTPDAILKSADKVASTLNTYYSADSTRFGLDTSLKLLFNKTKFGYFSAGWAKSEYGKATDVSMLSPMQRREIVGTYWISPENMRRFPLPRDIVAFGTRLFRQGVLANGEIPLTYKGKQLTLKDIATKTKLKVVSIYGGLDRMVPDRTAYLLAPLFGDRYRHVVHPLAGHVSYVFSPAQWDKAHPAAFKPNPVDVLLEGAS